MITNSELSDRKLALVDLDGTLIDANYKVTDPDIFSVIAETQECGWQLGLNSDTPYDALCVWRERFGLNGPIVAENGAVVEINGQPKFDAETVRAFTEARAATVALFEDQGIRIWSGNPVEALRDGLRIGNVDERIILLNAIGQASLRFFVRRVNDLGNLVTDNATAKELIAKVRPQFPAFDDIAEEFNSEYGLVIVSRKCNSKRSGMRLLMNTLGIQRVVMIGNTMSDYIGSDIAWHGAVGDATAEFREQSDYTSDGKNTTTGVVEILDKLRSDWMT